MQVERRQWIIEPLQSLLIGFASVTMIGIVLSLAVSAFLILRNLLF
jgi:hypothetical protein